MTHVGIREAKMHLSRLLRQVREGEEVVITDHGRAIGKIIPVLPRRGSLEDLERDLELRGIIEKRGDSPAFPAGRPGWLLDGLEHRAPEGTANMFTAPPDVRAVYLARFQTR